MTHTPTAEWEKPTVHLDADPAHPILAHNTLRIAGRATGPEPIESVRLQIAELRFDLPVETASSRFELVLDTSEWQRGDYSYSLRALDRSGARSEASGLAEVQPYAAPPTGQATVIEAVNRGMPAMWCEEPALDGGVLAGADPEIKGWAISPVGIRRVLITIDGHRRLVALHGLPRTDFRWCFGDALSEACGFVLRLHEEELPPGRHELVVVAVAEDGSAQGLCGSVERSAPAEPERGQQRGIEPLPATAMPTPAANGKGDSQLGTAAIGELWRERCVGAETMLATLRTEAFYVAEAQLRTIAHAAETRDEQERRLARLETELKRAQAEGLRMQHSLSWRLTSPLRALKRVLSGARPKP